jgi:hypothetical protein
MGRDMKEGFLGTTAPLRADLVFLLEIAMGGVLLIGALLGRMRRYRWHAGSGCGADIVVESTFRLLFARQAKGKRKLVLWGFLAN